MVPPRDELARATSLFPLLRPTHIAHRSRAPNCTLIVTQHNVTRDAVDPQGRRGGRVGAADGIRP